MIQYTKEIEQRLASGSIDKNELSSYLMENYRIKDISDALAELIIECEREMAIQPITVTQGEFNRITSLFRVRGTKVDGTVERRGRKRKEQ